jgi:AcrR family transcriptional regulator
MKGERVVGPNRLTREESKQQTKRQIADAARSLFAEQGYRRTSLDQIAETAGYTKGAVYSNWESKEALFLELLDEQAAEQSLEASTDLTPTRWALATLEFFLEAIDNETLRASLAQRYQTIRTQVAQQFEASGPKPEWGTWEELSTVIMALGSGLIIQNAIDPEATSETLLPRVIQQLT